MLQAMEKVRHTKVHAKDGDIGHIEEFYFDDEKWAVRYLVVDTAAWIFGRKVLISPFSVEDFDIDNDRTRLGLTKDQIKNSPDIDTKQPISRLQEREYNRYYGIPYYWGGTGMWGNAAYPAAMPVAIKYKRRTHRAGTAQYAEHASEKLTRGERVQYQSYRRKHRSCRRLSL